MRGIRARLYSIPLTVLLFLAGALLLAIGGGGYAALRMYDYVQHDNDFCLSCHLMEDPFQRFQASAHRGLGCKACHQPTPFQRAKMGLAQIVDNPKSIGVHAEVPNQRCEHCHVEGDPDKWIIISQSRGHRIHLQSADARLRGLECVTCHSESIHDFEATNRSCTQSGCHDDQAVALGGMADLNLACVACHAFVEPPARFADSPHEADSLTMAPNADECLSCHEMRERTGLDRTATEPHGANCSLCHNAHKQRRAVDAEARCSDALCHGRARDVNDNHHQWRNIDLLACLQCHRPHDFKVQGDNCGSCHSDIVGDAAAPDPTAGSDSMAAPAPLEGLPRPLPAYGGAEPVHGPSPPADAVLLSWPGSTSQVTPQVTPRDSGDSRKAVFTHDRHRSVDCGNCHTRQNVPNVNDRAWCADCHHTARSRRPCSTCHPTSGLPEKTLELEMALPGGPAQREVTFAHGRHVGAVQCTECHGEPPTRARAEGACLDCHDRHHTTAGVRCAGCHRPPPAWAHEASVVHGGCTGGVCHKRFPVQDPEQFSRSVCEACHQEFVGMDSLPPLPPTLRSDTSQINKSPSLSTPLGIRP